MKPLDFTELTKQRLDVNNNNDEEFPSEQKSESEGDGASIVTDSDYDVNDKEEYDKNNDS